MNKPSIDIFTDGSCAPTNPGPGGWAYLIIRDNSEHVTSGGSEFTTNNRMEMTAAIEALSSIPSGESINLYTDSQYLKNGITIWIKQWKTSGRLYGGTKKVKNSDLWHRLDSETERLDITWYWVKAHSNNRCNEIVDKAAREAAQQFSKVH